MAAAKSLLNFLLLSLLAAVTTASISALPDGGGHLPLTLLSADPTAAGCRGSLGECLAGDDELGLGHHGRALYGSGEYISYGALRRDSVPCSLRGANFYNCRPGAQANPYRRAAAAAPASRAAAAEAPSRGE